MGRRYRIEDASRTAIIQERVNAGLPAARARGVKLGRKPTLPQHRETVERLLAEGKGVRAIARECGLPVSSVHKLARNGKVELGNEP